MTDIETRVSGLVGRTAYDTQGSKVGKVDTIYTDDATGQPEWLAIKTGWFGSNLSFVPLQGAQQQDDDTLIIGWNKDTVRDAPNVDPDGHLSEEEEARLYDHYRLHTTFGAGNVDGPQAQEAIATQQSSDGRDTSGPTTDDAMTRSEERVEGRAEQREVGKARLRKWVETEHQTVTVPVRKEKVRLEREAIDEGNIDRAMSGPGLSEEEHEITLTEERPVIDKEVVPVERVRLEKDVDITEQQVGTDVRKERIELDDETQRRR